MSRWTQRTIGSIAATLGALALTLSALGIYAVTAYAATRRTKEAGIRIAVGATERDVVRLFVRGAAWPAAAGVALGLLGAVGLTRALQSLLPAAGAGWRPGDARRRHAGGGGGRRRRGGPGPVASLTAIR